MRKYRFDNAYEKVYRYSKENHAYIYIGSYIAYGITKKMSYKQAVKKVEQS